VGQIINPEGSQIFSARYANNSSKKKIQMSHPWLITAIGLLLIIGNGPYADCVSILTEDGGDFGNGTLIDTRLHNGSLELAENKSSLLNWTKMSDGIPQGRHNSGLVYDPVNEALVMFGGTDSGCFNETWMFNTGSRVWTNVNTVDAPSRRQAQVMAYDESRSTIMLFGGDDNWATYMNDTWIFNTTSNRWVDMKPQIAPSARSYAAMVYDIKNAVFILFGGFNNEDGIRTKNDTWIYSLRNNTWTDMNPKESPPPREMHAMAYDSISGDVILFGGMWSDSDTWIYNLSANIWINRSSSSAPSARWGHSMVWDPGRGKMVLFGGFDDKSLTNDTWCYDPDTNNWTNMEPAPVPPAREWHAATYDRGLGKSIIFGGENNISIVFNDIWTYDIKTNIWTNIAPDQIPACRVDFSMAYDAGKAESVLFGGLDESKFRDDTWTYNSSTNTWKNMNPMLKPPPRAETRMAYDYSAGAIVLFGGSNSSAMNDTWTYESMSNRWTNRIPMVSPSPRLGHHLAYDVKHDLVILFGGGDDISMKNDTWAYDLHTNVWKEMKPAVSPPPRAYGGMVFDDSIGQAVLFGGTNRTALLGDTWTYDIDTNTWTLMDTPLSPSARWRPSMTIDSTRDEILLLGGYNGTVQGDSWIYNSTTNQWTKKEFSTFPTARVGHEVTYDRMLDIFVLFGGDDGHSMRSETWVYNRTCLVGSGEYTSAPRNLNGSAYFGKISWEINSPLGTSIKFQLRTANDANNLSTMDFIGPDGSRNTYYRTSGQQISSVHNGSGYLQYRAILGTTNPIKSPEIKTVTIDYNIIPSLSIISPRSDDNWTGTHNISWSINDRDNDLFTFDIYLENYTIGIPLATDIPNGTNQWSWNTSSVPNGTYRIRITADDDNPSIPLAVNATSGNFTIFHPPPPPPPNYPPTVTLLAPLNNTVLNATSVRLSWNATDPEGDPLTFTVRYSDRLLDLATTSSNQTNAEFLDLTNLSDNTTYFWTVDAGDGTNGHTDRPADIWAFTVILPPVEPPPVNHPPRITSLPPTTITAGETFTYDVTAIDEDFTVLRFSLVQAPPNMSVDNITGKIHWTTTASDIGNHTVTLQVSDTGGATDNQTFTIQVLEPPIPPIPPTCKITSPANGSKVSGTIHIRGTAAIGRLPLSSVFVRIDGSDWKLATGLENWSLPVDTSSLAGGKHKIEARAFDGALYSNTTSVQITVQRPESVVTTEPFPLYLVVILVVIILGLGVYLLSRKKSK